MKALNPFRFITDAATELEQYYRQISDAETYDDARRAANRAMGYTDCLITFNNAMICTENNDFTGDYDTVISRYVSRVYGLLADAAARTGQDPELVSKLYRFRDTCTDL